MLGDMTARVCPAEVWLEMRTLRASKARRTFQRSYTYVVYARSFRLAPCALRRNLVLSSVLSRKYVHIVVPL
jgi:hypothetical protein